MTEHTRKEAEAINTAWSFLWGLADRTDYRARAMLEEGLKTERRERSSMTAAKALMVRSALEDRGLPASQLYQLATGCRLAAIVGAALSERFPAEWESVAGKIAQATAAHAAALDRAMDALKS